jgi:transposase
LLQDDDIFLAKEGPSMHHRHAITDTQWLLVEKLLPGRGEGPGPVAANNRRFIDAVFWIAKTGAPWRDLPERFGPWNSVFRRFSRWAKRGRWAKIVEVLAGAPDLEALILDSTIVRAHAHAAGAQKKRREGKPSKASGVRAAGSAASCTWQSTPAECRSN